MKPRTCTRCGYEGHDRRICGRVKPERDAKPPADGARRCGVCRQPGHYSLTCRWSLEAGALDVAVPDDLLARLNDIAVAQHRGRPPSRAVLIGCYLLGVQDALR